MAGIIIPRGKGIGKDMAKQQDTDLKGYHEEL
jgi:hypothetical protein